MTEENLPVTKEYLAEQIKNYDEYRKLDRIGKADGICKLNIYGKVDPSQIILPENTVITEDGHSASITKIGSEPVIKMDGEVIEVNKVNKVNGKKGNVVLTSEDITFNEEKLYDVLSNLISRMNKVDFMPVGTIISTLSEVPPNDSWAICGYNTYLKKADYPELYNLIGLKYTPMGADPEGEYFYLPDLRGKFIEGTPVDYNLGDEIEAGIPNITGGLLCGSHSFNVGLGGYEGAIYNPNKKQGATRSGDSGSDWQGSFAFDASKGECSAKTGELKGEGAKHVYGKSSTVQPEAICVNYIIKIK